MVQYLGVLGTGSSVGKSAIASALGRQLADAGRRVAPFKPQNIATNAGPALRSDGGWGEIGTAQVVQAQACRQPPLTAMNPVLLKPLPDGGCETVIDGRVIDPAELGDHPARTRTLRRLIGQQLHALAQATAAEVVVIEGAGSCIEMNLHDRDIGNLALLRELDAPWILVADIDRGGIYAQVVGTMALLPADWRRCVAVVVNRLRGDPCWFADGARDLEARTGRPVHVLTELPDLHLPEEDNAGLCWEHRASPAVDPARRQLVVVHLPALAMTGDLAPVAADPLWQVHWCRHPPTFRPDAVILPGSKHSGSDLAWLQAGPWAAWLRDHAASGGRILGLCGGYQLLGEGFSDPDGRDGPAGDHAGLGLLPVDTRTDAVKHIRPRAGELADGSPVAGYEIHWGQTRRSGGEALVHFADGDSDGCRTGQIAGTYLHSILATAAARQALLGAGSATSTDPIDRLASHCAAAGIVARDLLARA